MFDMKTPLGLSRHVHVTARERESMHEMNQKTTACQKCVHLLLCI